MAVQDRLESSLAPRGRSGALIELRRLDFVLLVAVGGLAALTLAAVWLPVAVGTEQLDLVLNTITAIAAAGAAALAWARYRAERHQSAVYESSAFLVLFLSRAYLVVVALLVLQPALGLNVENAAQWPAYGWTAARLGSALLLVRAAMVELRPDRQRSARRLVGLLLVPSVAIMVVLLALPLAEPVLPAIVLTNLLPDPSAPTPPRPVMAAMVPIAMFAQAIIAGLYLWAASLYRRLFRTRGRRYAAYLSLAMVIAAFSQVHFAIMPGIYAPAVTMDDALRAAMSIVLLFGIQAQANEDLDRLRLANSELEEHRTIEAERAAAEAATAREIHDGIAQELWLAKLKLSGLAGAPDLGRKSRPLAEESVIAVDRALEHARNAVSDIRSRTSAAPLGDSLAELAADFGERSGIKAEVIGEAPELSPRSVAEVVRIVREALANVHKHADATVVRILIRSDGDITELTVADNGRGFATGQASGTGYGIRGMRERAELIGGDITIQSRPQDGTRVVLRLDDER